MLLSNMNMCASFSFKTENDADDRPEEGTTRSTRHDQIQPQLIINESREEILVSPVLT